MVNVEKRLEKLRFLGNIEYEHGTNKFNGEYFLSILNKGSVADLSYIDNVDVLSIEFPSGTEEIELVLPKKVGRLYVSSKQCSFKFLDNLDKVGTLEKGSFKESKFFDCDLRFDKCDISDKCADMESTFTLCKFTDCRLEFTGRINKCISNICYTNRFVKCDIVFTGVSVSTGTMLTSDFKECNIKFHGSKIGSNSSDSRKSNVPFLFCNIVSTNVEFDNTVIENNAFTSTNWADSKIKVCDRTYIGEGAFGVSDILPMSGNIAIGNELEFNSNDIIVGDSVKDTIENNVPKNLICMSSNITLKDVKSGKVYSIEQEEVK